MGLTSTDMFEFPIEPPGDFTERVVEAFFRRWYLYVMPVLVFGALGVYSAGQITAEYTSQGRLNATANPFVDQPDIRGTEIGDFEAPATGTARLITEQLQTDSFLDDVIERAGLADSLARDEIVREDVRARLTAWPAGQNNLTVDASWADPGTALQLVNATIVGYREYLANLAVADSDEAVAFWTAQKEEKTTVVTAAEEALDSRLATLPPIAPGLARPTEETLELQRLNGAIDRAIEDERAAQIEIDRAELAGRQAMSTSARELLVVDEAEAATAPSGVRREQLALIVVFTGLGVVLSAAAVVIGTSIDRSVRTTAQLRSASGVPTVVKVPRIKQLAKLHRSSRRTQEVAVP